MQLGEFHTSMAYMACTGSRLGEVAFWDVLIESGAVAHGSINGVISGHHYNRSVRAHKLVFDALSRLMWMILKSYSQRNRDYILAIF